MKLAMESLNSNLESQEFDNIVIKKELDTPVIKEEVEENKFDEWPILNVYIKEEFILPDERHVKKDYRMAENCADLGAMESTQVECYFGEADTDRGMERIDAMRMQHVDMSLLKFENCLSLKELLRTSEFYFTGRQKVHEVKLFECNFCESSFVESENCKVHERQYHSLRKLFKCSVCDKVFNRLNHCKVHEQKHELQPIVEKSFKCKICDKLFSLSNSCKRHERTHLNRPFKCKFCNKSFTVSSSCMRHVMMSH